MTAHKPSGVVCRSAVSLLRTATPLFAAIVSWSASVAHAVPIEFATGRLEYWLGGSPVVMEVDEPAVHIYLNETENGRVFARSQLGFGVPYVEAEVDLQISPGPIGPIEISARAYAHYQMRINPTQTAPVSGITTLPILILAHGETNFNPNHGGGLASVYIEQDGQQIFFRQAPPNFGGDGVATAGIDSIADIYLTAIAYATIIDGVSTNSKTLADPIFSFDQAAFDALMGEDTFLLNDYYAFEFSENAVPEPSGLILAAVATGAGAWCRRRRPSANGDVARPIPGLESAGGAL